MELRAITNEEQHKNYLAEVECLIETDPDIGTPAANRLEVISILIEKYEAEKFPIEMPDPIQAIIFRMTEQGLRQRDLVPYIGSRSKVSEVLSGKRKLSISMIRKLVEGLVIPAAVLLQEQTEANDLTTQDSTVEEIDYTRFPVKELIRRGWIKATEDMQSSIESFLMPIGKMPQIVMCRRSFHSRGEFDHYSLLAWIAKLLDEANKEDLATYSQEGITKTFLSQVAKLSWAEEGPLLAKRFLANYGIALVTLSHLPKTRLDGAALWSPKSYPVIGLTLRYDRLDNFWHTLLHELVHLYLHLNDKKTIFVDNLEVAGNDSYEKEADKLAREVLLPRAAWNRSDARRTRNIDAINALAKQLHISPTIIVGQIRREESNYAILSDHVGQNEVRKHFVH